MDARSAGATRWLVVVLGVSLALGCTDRRRRGFCGDYAVTVSDCCSDHEYEHLRAICEQDLRTASGIGPGCSQAVRELYECAEAHACEDACHEESPGPCSQEEQAMVGICSESPPPPGP